MRVMRLFAPGDFRMVDEPVPIPGPGEVLIRVGSVSVCASDIHWYQDGRIGTSIMTEPLVLGHEGSGTIEAVGDGVRLTPGQKVSIEPSRPCMECSYCASGDYNVCPNVQFFGTPPTDGCFRDYVVWPAELALPTPDSVTLDEAAIVEPLAVGLYAAQLAKASHGESVAILGAGAIGLSVLQAIRLTDVGNLMVSDPVSSRRDVAMRLGATAVCKPEDVQKVRDELTDGRGFDVVIECAGDNAAVQETARLVRILGRILIVGIPRENDYVFDASAARRKQLSVTFVRRSNLTAEPVIDLIRQKKLDAMSLATHFFPLEQVEDAMKLAESKSDGVVRAVIRVS